MLKWTVVHNHNIKLSLTNLVMLYEVGGHARLLDIATLESETSQREEHAQTTTQSWQEVATTNIRE